MTWLNFSGGLQGPLARWLGHGGIVLGMIGLVYGIELRFRTEKSE